MSQWPCALYVARHCDAHFQVVYGDVQLKNAANGKLYYLIIGTASKMIHLIDNYVNRHLQLANCHLVCSVEQNYTVLFYGDSR